MRFGTIFCFALAICLAHADEGATNTVEPGTSVSPLTSSTPNATTTVPPVTTTVPPVTTTVPPVTTTVPPSAPTEPTPAKENFLVNGTDSVCILADFAAQVLIKYDNTVNKSQTAYLNVVNATVNKDSRCGANESVLSLDFGKDNLVLSFINDNGKKYVKEVVLQYVPNEEIFPGHPKIGQKLTTTFSNLTLFQVSDIKSYTCATEEAKNDDATLTFSSVQVESFRTAKTTDFSQAQDCVTEKVSDLVPIAVGCALLALVLIVLIAYFIGRRRSRRLAYQSV